MELSEIPSGLTVNINPEVAKLFESEAKPLPVKKLMELSEIDGFLHKCGYSDEETKDNHRVYYEFSKTDFLYSDCAKKYDMDYDDGKVEKVFMTRYWLGKTEIKEITTMEELYDSI